MSPPTDGQQTAGEIYFDLFEGLVQDQHERKASIETRGLSVITTSGALVTLLFGLIAVITGVKNYELPRAAHGPLAFAAGLFVMAGLLALLTNLPIGYANLDADGIDEIFDKQWNKSADDARMRVSVMRGKIFWSAQRANEAKARVLQAAVAFEVAGVLAIAMAVAEVIKAD